MNVAYHAHYLQWAELGRTEHLRRHGVRYRDLEERGFRLAVAEAALRLVRPARYDDLLRVTAWLTEVGLPQGRLRLPHRAATASSSPRRRPRSSRSTADGRAGRLPDDVLAAAARAAAADRHERPERMNRSSRVALRRRCCWRCPPPSAPRTQAVRHRPGPAARARGPARVRRRRAAPRGAAPGRAGPRARGAAPSDGSATAPARRSCSQLLTDPDSDGPGRGGLRPRPAARLDGGPGAGPPAGGVRRRRRRPTTDLEIVTALAKIGGGPAAQALDGLLARHPPTGRAGGPRHRRRRCSRRGGWAGSRRATASWRTCGTGRGCGAATRSTARRGCGSPRRRRALVDATGGRRPADAAVGGARAHGGRWPIPRRIPRSVFVGRLRQLVGDDDAQVRINAVRALGTFRDSALVAVIAPRLVDRDQNVVVQAAAAVGALGGSRGRGDAGGALRPAGDLRGAARRAAGAGRGGPGRGARRRACRGRRTRDWRMRGAYAEMLGIAATPEARAAPRGAGGRRRRPGGGAGAGGAARQVGARRRHRAAPARAGAASSTPT